MICYFVLSMQCPQTIQHHAVIVNSSDISALFLNLLLLYVHNQIKLFHAYTSNIEEIRAMKKLCNSHKFGIFLFSNFYIFTLS